MSEVTNLYEIIRNLKSKGKTVIYISHRLEELQSIVDRVTIMRDGQYITSMNFRDTTLDEIIANIGICWTDGSGQDRDHQGYIRH